MAADLICSGHGHIVGSSCVCDHGWTGRDELKDWGDCHVSVSMYKGIFLAAVISALILTIRTLYVAYYVWEPDEDRPSHTLKFKSSGYIRSFHAFQLSFSLFALLRLVMGLVGDARHYELLFIPTALLWIASSSFLSSLVVLPAAWYTTLGSHGDNNNNNSSNSNSGSGNNSNGQQPNTTTSNLLPPTTTSPSHSETDRLLVTVAGKPPYLNPRHSPSETSRLISMLGNEDNSSNSPEVSGNSQDRRGGGGGGGGMGAGRNGSGIAGNGNGCCRRQGRRSCVDKTCGCLCCCCICCFRRCSLRPILIDYLWAVIMAMWVGVFVGTFGPMFVKSEVLWRWEKMTVFITVYEGVLWGGIAVSVTVHLTVRRRVLKLMTAVQRHSSHGDEERATRIANMSTRLRRSSFILFLGGLAGVVLLPISWATLWARRHVYISFIALVEIGFFHTMYESCFNSPRGTARPRTLDTAKETTQLTDRNTRGRDRIGSLNSVDRVVVPAAVGHQRGSRGQPAAARRGGSGGGGGGS